MKQRIDNYVNLWYNSTVIQNLKKGGRTMSNFTVKAELENGIFLMTPNNYGKYEDTGCKEQCDEYCDGHCEGRCAGQCQGHCKE